MLNELVTSDIYTVKKLAAVKIDTYNSEILS